MNQPPTATPPPPEAVLIRRARQANGVSPEKAAPLLPEGLIKAPQWRNIESGKSYAKDAVLAHMAYVVGVSPHQLEMAGREEAAEILRELVRQRASDRPPVDPREVEIRAMKSLSDEEKDYLVKSLKPRRNPEPPGHRSEAG